VSRRQIVKELDQKPDQGFERRLRLVMKDGKSARFRHIIPFALILDLANADKSNPPKWQ